MPRDTSTKSNLLHGLDTLCTMHRLANAHDGHHRDVFPRRDDCVPPSWCAGQLRL